MCVWALSIEGTVRRESRRIDEKWSPYNGSVEESKNTEESNNNTRSDNFDVERSSQERCGMTGASQVDKC